MDAAMTHSGRRSFFALARGELNSGRRGRCGFVAAILSCKEPRIRVDWEASAVRRASELVKLWWSHMPPPPCAREVAADGCGAAATCAADGTRAERLPAATLLPLGIRRGGILRAISFLTGTLVCATAAALAFVRRLVR